MYIMLFNLVLYSSPLFRGAALMSGPEDQIDSAIAAGSKVCALDVFALILHHPLHRGHGLLDGRVAKKDMSAEMASARAWGVPSFLCVAAGMSVAEWYFHQVPIRNTQSIEIYLTS